MLKVYCGRCAAELLELGALVFSPPVEGKRQEFHVCKECYDRTMGPEGYRR